MLLFYYLRCRLCVSSFWSVSYFFLFPSNPWFLHQYPWLLLQTPLLILFYVFYRTQSVQLGGWGGFPWVAWRSSWPCTRFYLGVRFNPPKRFPITDPSPACFPTGDWGVELRGSSVSSISWPQFRFDRLPTPVLEKGVPPLSLTWIDSIARILTGLPSLAFFPLKEQTDKIVSVGHDSDNYLYPCW